MSDIPDGQPLEDEKSPELVESYAMLYRRKDRLGNVSVRLQLLKFGKVEDSMLALIVDEIIDGMEASEFALRKFFEASGNSISDHPSKSAAANEFRDVLAEVRNCQLQNAKSSADTDIEDPDFLAPCILMLRDCRIPFSSGDSSTEFRQRSDSKVSLQLLVSYLAFCSEKKISSCTALDILDECGVGCGARGAPRTAFIEAFYRAADLALTITPSRQHLDSQL